MGIPKQRSTTGNSVRTPAKHCLMCKLYGQEIGSAHYNPDITDLHWIDLTAGDGAAANGGEWVKNCSPGLLAYYARFPEYRGSALTGRLLVSKPVRVDLYERSERTFISLLKNLDHNLPGLGYTRVDEDHWTCGPVVLRVHNKNGEEADLSGVAPTTAVRINNDPNAIVDWAMPEAMPAGIRNATPWFLGICTMGCNVGGLKRLLIEQPEEADRWRNLVYSVVSGLPRWHDLYLCAIDRDASQWAYLVIAPKGRTGRTDWRLITERGAAGCFRKSGMNLRGAWWRSDSAQFMQIIDYLFTVKSRSSA